MSEFEKKPEENQENEEEDDGPVQEEESTATFVPVVKLEKIEVKTGEEDDDIFCQIRSKLFEYGETLLDKGTGVKTWKEKGVGEFKILKNRNTGKYRALMRQEKTMKLIANFAIDHRITLTPHAGSNKAWVWAAFDFSDGEVVDRTFAMKFNTVEHSTEFKSKFEEAQAAMKELQSGADAATGASEADEAAEAIAKVTVSESTEEPKKDETESA